MPRKSGILSVLVSVPARTTTAARQRYREELLKRIAFGRDAQCGEERGTGGRRYGGTVALSPIKFALRGTEGNCKLASPGAIGAVVAIIFRPSSAQSAVALVVCGCFYPAASDESCCGGRRVLT
jgi:hypothetical protein